MTTTGPSEPSPHSPDAELQLVASRLDPVLVPLGFAPGQLGGDVGTAQVIFCRGYLGADDDEGCVDLVIDLERKPDWRISDVRYWGFELDRFHLGFDRESELSTQLEELRRTLPQTLSD